MTAEVKSMDAKKTQPATDSVSIGKQAQEFVTEVKSEINKISWTTKSELIFYTKVVVIATFVFGLSIYALDLFIQAVLNSLNLISNFIIG